MIYRNLLKIRWRATSVPVRVRPPAPFYLDAQTRPGLRSSLKLRARVCACEPWRVRTGSASAYNCYLMLGPVIPEFAQQISGNSRLFGQVIAAPPPGSPPGFRLRRRRQSPARRRGMYLCSPVSRGPVPNCGQARRSGRRTRALPVLRATPPPPRAGRPAHH